MTKSTAYSSTYSGVLNTRGVLIIGGRGGGGSEKFKIINKWGGGGGRKI